MRIGLGVLVGCVAALAGSPARAQNADCTRAKDEIEKVVCADPRAAAADKAMAAAYSALHARLQGKDRDALLRSQRAWIMRRGGDCESGKPGFAACIADDAERRRAFLEARAESGPGAGAVLQPLLVMQPGRKGGYEISMELLKFADPKAAGEKTFNAAIDRQVAEIPVDTKDIGKNEIYSHSVAVRLTYASPRLLSARFDGYDFTGGAHGMSPTWGLSIDMQSGRKLAFADAFDKLAHEKLDQECLKQILAQKKERMGELPAGDDLAEMRKALAKGVGDFAGWSFAARGADVVFNQYDLGSYAEGRYACAFPLAQLKSLAKPGFPLPE
jgi:uncharacterized protein YecT (DUF1311 family)